MALTRRKLLNTKTPYFCQCQSHRLESLDELGRGSINASIRARGLYAQLISGNTLLGLQMALLVLKPLELLNRSFQSRTNTVAGMMQAVELILKELSRTRTEDAFDKVLHETNEKIEQLGLDELKLPRQHRVPVRFTEPSAAYIAQSIQEHFRPLLYQFLDVTTNELSDRFTRSDDMRQYETWTGATFRMHR